MRAPILVLSFVLQYRLALFVSLPVVGVGAPLLTPTRFGLVGIQKVPGCQAFPSDHWGIRALFNINKEG